MRDVITDLRAIKNIFPGIKKIVVDKIVYRRFELALRTMSRIHLGDETKLAYLNKMFVDGVEIESEELTQKRERGND